MPLIKLVGIIALSIVLIIICIGLILLTYRIILGLIRDKQMVWYKRLLWYVKEFVKCLSNEPSFFSSKRIMAVVAFTILEWGMVHWMVVQLLSKTCAITASELFIWASIQAAFCGFSLSKIQKEKESNPDPKN